MIRLLKNIFATTLLLVLGTAVSFAQTKTLEVDAPAMVAKGIPFNIQYSIAMKPGRITMPSLEGFVEIGNASASHMGEAIENGKRVQVSVTTYTFVLVPQIAGTFNLPAASVMVDGQTYTSKSIPIEIVDEGRGASSGDEQQAGLSASGGSASQSKTSTDEAVFLRAISDKTTVYKGEPIRVRFKLYTRHSNLADEGAKKPAFNGFWAQELPVAHYQPQQESYNSRVYRTYIIQEYLLFPTQSGTLKIDPMTMDIVMREFQQPQARTMEDFFMGGGLPDVKETKKKIASQTINVNVKDLPANQPAEFNNAVGNFTMSVELPQETINANSSATYKIKITGTGNIPLIQAPEVEMPASFEKYTTKKVESIRPTATGITGSQEFEYPFIARAEGDYRIRPVVFSFFNPQKGEYVTLSSGEVKLHVLADTTSTSAISSGGMVGGISRKDFELLNSDIRFIKRDSPNLKPQGTVLMCSVAYFITMGVLIAAFIFLLLYLQRRIKQMKDADIMRGRRANKVVLARLKVAEEYMKEENQRRFHDEILKALWGYLSDKLNIPVANFTKENVRERLLKREVPLEQINEYVDLISESEYAQYSPAESASMQDVYRSAVVIISKFESYFRK